MSNFYANFFTKLCTFPLYQGYLQGILITFLLLSYSQMLQSRPINGYKSLFNDQPMFLTNYNQLLSTLPHKSSSHHYRSQFTPSLSKSSQIKPPTQFLHRSSSFSSLAPPIHSLSSSTYSQLSSYSSLSSSSSSISSSDSADYPPTSPLTVLTSFSSSFNSSVLRSLPLSCILKSPPCPSTKHHHQRHRPKHSHFRGKSESSPRKQLFHVKDLDTSSIKRHKTRLVYLLPKCNHRYIEIYDNSVSATAKDSSNATLRIHSLLIGKHNHSRGVHAVSIQGDRSGKYLCYGKGGRIIAKLNGDRDLGCLFREIHRESLYRQYQSMYNPNWLLGFNKNGKPIRGRKNPGHYRHRNKDCFKFVKKLEKIKHRHLHRH